MKQVIVLNKREGETPLEALGVFRRKHKQYENLPMTYAGRLDPMASGLLLVLAGSECKHKEKYLKLDKEYEFQVLFGISTDTHDILGKVDAVASMANLSRINTRILKSQIKDFLKSFLGSREQKYPVFSSKTVAGKQLWQYARAGADVEPPERHIEIKKLVLQKIHSVNTSTLWPKIQKRISKVKGDFRQKEILELWAQVLKEPQNYCLASFKVSCSSGTYVRVLAKEFGAKLSMPALAYSIKRTRIGKWRKAS